MTTTKWSFYKVLCGFTGVLFIHLFYTLFFNSSTLMHDIGLQSSESTTILSRRTAMFMLGIAVLMLGAARLPHSQARQLICLATGITMLGLSIMGSYELSKGTVSSGILTSIVVETILWLSFGFIYLKNRRSPVDQA